MTDQPLILWFRRDLRLADNPMLTAALATGRPLVPVFILDPETQAIGAAAKWRLGLSVEDFAARLEKLGLRLILRKGPALAVLQALITEIGAAGVMWSRLYDPAAQARDAAIKADLTAKGLIARSFAGHLLFEPWTVATGTGGYYKVYTPFWRCVQTSDVAVPDPEPVSAKPPKDWPVSDKLGDWNLGSAMRRGAGVVLGHQRIGEQAALARLASFVDQRIGPYRERRDYLAEAASSGLSENLTYGEVGPRQVWHAGMRALQEGAAGAEHFVKELVWREFAYHLMYHSPQILTRNWREDWDGFAWRADNADAERWRRGFTGEPVIDAAMREMYVTGTMHNRARMLVASYLTKHLLTDWRIGLDWFADCLTDWDPAANAMGWQWVAGSGPDAAPYFRIFNPATQAEKFDPDGKYRRRWLHPASAEAASYFDAVPKAWGVRAGSPYPAPAIDLAVGRARALAALAARKA